MEKEAASSSAGKQNLMRADAFTFLLLLITCAIVWACVFFFYWMPMYKHRLLVVLAEGKGLALQGSEVGKRAHVPRSVTYVLLHELEDAGLVRCTSEPGYRGAELRSLLRGGLPRFFYSITFHGTLHLARKAVGRASRG